MRTPRDPGPVAPGFPLQRAVHGMVGTGPAMQAVFRKIDRYADADAPVLVTGETGTGKELVARALHVAGPRRGRAWVALNCAALSEDLVESELFGHERGAFTGAISQRKGRFERADGGTLFLDEVGEMPLRVQARFLRVLENGTFERVGGERELRADVRLVAATNVPLERAVAEKRFREDLFHRVAVLRVHTPALRDRTEDLPLLAQHFLDLFNHRYGKAIRRVTPDALEVLAEYTWPGNVRELRNVLERIYVECDGEVVGARALAEWVREREVLAAGAWNLSLRDEERLTGPTIIVPAEGYGVRTAAEGAACVVPSLASAPRALPAPAVVQRLPAPVRAGRRPHDLTAEEIREALATAGGNVTRAAGILGCHKTTLYRAVARLGLDVDELRKGVAGDRESGGRR